VELAVDGPAGPLYQARRGCAELALATGAPLVALAYDSPLAFTTPLRWDRQRLVLPFARVEVAARLVPRHADDTVEALLARVQATLDALEREARGESPARPALWGARGVPVHRPAAGAPAEPEGEAQEDHPGVT